jgi:hypothetical protein
LVQFFGTVKWPEYERKTTLMPPGQDLHDGTIRLLTVRASQLRTLLAETVDVMVPSQAPARGLACAGEVPVARMDAGSAATRRRAVLPPIAARIRRAFITPLP